MTCPQPLDRPPRPLQRLPLGVALEGEHQGGAGRLRRPGVAGERQQPAVEQVAGDRGERPQVEPGPNGRVEGGEPEQGDAHPAGQRHRPEHRPGHERERPLATDEQPGQVGFVAGEHVVQDVPAPVERRPRTGQVDQLAVGGEQRRDRRPYFLRPGCPQAPVS